jgi:hypothetical protein
MRPTVNIRRLQAMELLSIDAAIAAGHDPSQHSRDAHRAVRAPAHFHIHGNPDRQQR